MHKFLKKVCQKIKEYEYIVIVRHQNSDMDALGSQYGLKKWVIDNFKDKKVYCLGENNSKYMKEFIPKSDTVDFDIENTKYLGICVDVFNFARVDANDTFQKAEYKICIDHHGNGEPDNFDLMYIDDSKISCAQIIATMLLSSKKKMSAETCKYLFAGISTDSGNFYYDKTNAETFLIASKLLEKGNFNQFYDVQMLINQTSLEEYRIQNKMFERMTFDEKSGVAYYIFKLDELKALKINPMDVNEQIGHFNRVEEYQIIFGACEYEPDLYRCSIRSKLKDVGLVARNFGGGGHKLASGVKGLNLDKVNELVNELKKL